MRDALNPSFATRSMAGFRKVYLMGFVKTILRVHAPGVYAALREAQNRRLSKKHQGMDEEEIRKELASMYRQRIGQDMNLECPNRYTEKIQWRKMYGLTPEMSLLSDKYAVRDWVKKRIGVEYLVPLLGHWCNPEDIEFDSLPNEFILKTNNGTSTNIIVHDKDRIDIKNVRSMLRRWLAAKPGLVSFERQYDSIPPSIIAESLLKPADGESDVKDYKFLCFDGEPRFVWVDLDRYTNHTRAMFDMNWELQDWNQYNYPPIPYVPARPVCLDEMIEVARKLSAGFDHVRVDLYEVSGKVYFGEMTFTNGSGLEPIVPDAFDAVLGSYWSLPTAQGLRRAE